MLLIPLIATMLFIVPLTNIHLARSQEVASLFVYPSIEDETYTPGTTFSVEVYVDDVESMFGYEVTLAYNTTVLTATNFVNYDPFSDLSPSKINDTAGYVNVAASYPIPEYFGLTTSDPTPIVLIEFQVDPGGYGYSALHLQSTVLVDVVGHVITHTTTDGRFVNLIVNNIVVTGVTANRTKVLPGRKIAIRATIYNDGTVDAGFDVSAFYDNNLAAPPQTVTGLIPKTSTTLTFIWDTTGVADGTYTIKANATLTTGTDSNPADNEKSDGTVTITSTVEHNIAITNVVTNTSLVVVTKFVAINVTVQNNGNIEETFDTSVYYSNSTADYLIETKTGIFLWDGNNTKLTYNWNTTNVYWGNYTIKAKAPITGDLTPADNEKSDGTVGVSLQDVAVIAVTLYNPLYPIVTIGDIAEFEVRVKNQGIQNATFTVTLYRNSTIIETQNVTDLQPTKIKSLTFNWNTTIVYPGNYTIKAVASTLYGEVNTADNTHYLDLALPIITVVGELHDVAVTAITAPSTILSGVTTPIQVTVQNLGTKDEAINATLYYDSTLIGKTDTERTIPAPPNALATTVLTFDWNTAGIPLGTYTLKANVTVVPNDVNATNNVLTIEVTIAIHNIAVTSFTANPTTAVAGQTINLNVTVQNQGNFSETFTVTLKYNDAIIGKAFSVTLAAGVTKSYPTPWKTSTGMAAGTYTLTANASAVEGEANTDDNVKTIQITIKITSAITLSVDPSEITIGESTTISGSIDKKPVGALVTIWYRSTGTSAWTNLTATAVEADGTYSYDWTPTTTGTYDVKTSWAGNATTMADESDQPYPTITVKAVEQPPSDITIFLIAGIAVVVVIVIAAVYFLKIRKPTAE
jgi:hypothetical protein